MTVYQGMMQHNKLGGVSANHRSFVENGRTYHEDEMLNGVPHPNLGHIKRHHALGNFGGMGEKAFHAYHGDLILHLEGYGDVKIRLVADWSPESVGYVHDIAKNSGEFGGCDRCHFYRAEKPGILQGMIVSNSLPKVDTKGDCPEEYADEKQNCPEHDPKCACHGPIMSKGMVGWAGGGTGPDFFINNYERPAKFWGNQHT